VSRPSSEATAPAAVKTAQARPAGLAALAGLGRRRLLRVRIGVQQVVLDLLGGPGTARVAALAQPYGALGDGLERAMPTDLGQAMTALEPALALLQTQLAARGLGSLRGARCQVTVDDSWMLYDVVRADLRGLAPRAADALIRASLADVAGVDPSELVTRWQAQGASAHTLACGLPTGALPALEQALRAQGLQLESIEGEFVRTYNRYRDRIEPKCSLIALVREAGAQLAVVIDGVLTATSFEFGIGAPKELELRGRGLLRAAGVGGEGSVKCYAFTPDGWKAPEPWVCLPIGI